MNDHLSSDKFLYPRKALGQNFLQDPNIVRKIVTSLNIKENDVVVEIGPGRGALTRLILPMCKHLHLIEFDRDLSQYWREQAESQSKLIVHESDILKFDLAKTFDRGQKIKVIGNLPYNISSPVLFYLMNYANNIDAQVLMLQKEVVQRMASLPGNKQFGRLSVMLQYRYQIENLFNVPPVAFIPPPKVDSAVARLMPLNKIDSVVTDESTFSIIVKAAFAQRRKTLRNTLKKFLSAEQIESVGIAPGARAETLSVQNFVKLSNLYSNLKHLTENS